VIDAETSHAFWRAVEAVPSGERTAVVLYYRDQLPVSDSARAVGGTTGPIKSWLLRARRHLRERLQSTEEIPG
jgi:DNA-directed RNA polymerase specialized sigma24 family protein